MTPVEREQVVLASRGLLVKCANRYKDYVGWMDFDDCYQEAALALIKALAQQREDYPLLFAQRLERRIHGAVIDKIRDSTGWRRKAQNVGEIVDVDEQDRQPTPEDLAIARQEERALRQAIALLPDKERAVIQRHYYGDEDLVAIGRSLGISAITISKYHKRGREHLHKQLAERVG